MINPQPGGTLYEQLAARLRKQILDGVLRPGQVAPSERSLADEHGIGRQTAGKAMQLLRSEGLLERRRGQGWFVRERDELTDLTPAPGSTGVVRMPTSQERADLGVDAGLPVVVITAPDGTTAVYPGDRWRLHWP